MKGTVIQILNWIYKQDKDKLYEIKEVKEKRSLSANSYFYVLQNKLASKLRISNEELHFELIKRYSSVILVTLPLSENIEGYCKYYEEYKKGTINGKSAIVYKIFKNSSEMNTSEFSRLLDGLITECQQQEIETLTPNELRKLKDYEE